MAKLLELKQALAQSMAVPEYQVDSLIERMTPVILVEDLVAAPPQPLERGCALAAAQAAGAAQYSQIQVYNPAGSGIIATVDGFNYSPLGATLDISAGFYDTLLPTAVLTRYSDRRLTPQVPACVGGKDDGASKVVGAALTLYMAKNLQHVTIQVNFPNPLVLLEGQGFVFEGTTVNIGLTGSIYWRERPKTEED